MLSGELIALYKDSFFELCHFQGRWGVQRQLALINNTTFLLLHQGYRPVHSAVTEMGVGPGLLAGKGEMWASESPRTIPPGSGSLEKSSTASNGSSLVPHGWEKLALTPSSFSSVEFATLSHQAKKAALSPPLFTLCFCSFFFPTSIRNSSNNAWDILCA